MPLKMKNPEAGRRLFILVPVLAALCLLAGCDDLKRFQQERYECTSNPQGLTEIDFRDFKVGSEATVTFTGKVVTMPIIESNDSRFSLADDTLVIRVDRATGTVRITRDSQYRNITCRKSEFSM